MAAAVDGENCDSIYRGLRGHFFNKKLLTVVLNQSGQILTDVGGEKKKKVNNKHATADTNGAKPQDLLIK